MIGLAKTTIILAQQSLERLAFPAYRHGWVLHLGALRYVT